MSTHKKIQIFENGLNELDLVCIMSVNPGIGGQKFNENTFNKEKELIRLKKETKSDFLIQIDGGVNLENAKISSFSGN